MSDELTAELRRVYEDAFNRRMHDVDGIAARCHEAGLLAVARHSAERQRGMEATEGMLQAAVKSSNGPAVYKVTSADGCYVLDKEANDAYIAMQSAAPLWVDRDKP